MKTKLLFSIILAGNLTAQTYSNNTVTPIPDNNVAGTTSIIPMSLVQTISDPSKVSIKLALTHTWGGDVTAALVVPGGASTGSIALIKRLGSTTAAGVGTGADFAAANVLSFNSAASGPINTTGLTGASVIPAGVYLPSGSAISNPTDYSPANLSTLLNGAAVNGDWTLKLFDGAVDDTGSLNNWQVVFDAGTFLGIDTAIINNPGLSVMGNPFKETLNLKINTAAKDLKFDIHSMDGRKVYSYNKATIGMNGEIKIPTDSWASGVYILSPNLNGEKLMNIKLIKK